jgi:hypothetical protein
MALSKKTVTDKIEIVRVKDYYLLQVREDKQIIENGARISGSYNRYVLNPDHDVSNITDDVVKEQFTAVMTNSVKENYAKFLKEQVEENKEGE